MKTNYEDIGEVYVQQNTSLDAEYRTIRSNIPYPLLECVSAQFLATYHPALQRAVLNHSIRVGTEEPLGPNSPLGSLILEERARFNFWMGGKVVHEFDPDLVVEILTLPEDTLVTSAVIPPTGCFLYYPRSGVKVVTDDGEIPINGCYVFKSSDNLETDWTANEDQPQPKFLAFEWVSCTYERGPGRVTNWRTVAHLPLESLETGWTIEELRKFHFCETDRLNFKDALELHSLALKTLLYMGCDNTSSVKLNKARHGVALTKDDLSVSKYTSLPCNHWSPTVGPQDVDSVKSGAILIPEARVSVPARISGNNWRSPQYLS